METKFYTIPGRLKKISRTDILSSCGKFSENTLFFIKNIGTLEFYGTYKITNVNTHLDNEESRRNIEYHKNEVEILLANHLIYKLTEDDVNCDFKFKMYIRTADEFDVFEGANFLAMNTIYYVHEENVIKGPFYINSYTIVETIKEKLAQGKILVPYKKQKFEPIQT